MTQILALIRDLIVWGIIPAAILWKVVPVMLERIWYYSDENPRRKHWIEKDY